MFRVMISKGYFMARRGTGRKSSFSRSIASSVIRSFHLRACEKTMISLHLTEWLEWKCRSVAKSVGFLYSLVENLRPAPMWIFMSKKNIS